jgi:hypothetical protein
MNPVCDNCGGEIDWLNTHPPTFGYMVFVGDSDRPLDDQLDEPCIAFYCEDCGKTLGLRRIDFTKERRREKQ